MTDRDGAWLHDSNPIRSTFKADFILTGLVVKNCDGRDGDENTGGIVGWGLPGTAKSSADKICVVGWRIDSLGYMLNDTHANGFSHL